MNRRGKSDKWVLPGKGFTLVEMLVVIAIIGILAAILLPVLGKIRTRGKRIECINNHRQLALIWAMYTSDNNDRLVSNGDGGTDGGNVSFKYWVQGFMGVNISRNLDPNKPDPPLGGFRDNTNSALITDPKYALFAPYLQKAKVYVCPADDPIIEEPIYLNGVKNYPRLRSYSLNAFVGWELYSAYWDKRLGVFDFPRNQPRDYVILKKSGDFVKSPSEIFLFQDVHPLSIDAPYFGVAMFNDGPDTYYHVPNSRHEKGGVISFADGHVERHLWKDQRTTGIWPTNTLIHAHGIVSPDNIDIKWLTSHTTTPR